MIINIIRRGINAIIRPKDTTDITRPTHRIGDVQTLIVAGMTDVIAHKPDARGKHVMYLIPITEFTDISRSGYVGLFIHKEEAGNDQDTL
jgi:hypothetical protein